MASVAAVSAVVHTAFVDTALHLQQTSLAPFVSQTHETDWLNGMRAVARI